MAVGREERARWDAENDLAIFIHDTARESQGKIVEKGCAALAQAIIAAGYQKPQRVVLAGGSASELSTQEQAAEILRLESDLREKKAALAARLRTANQ